MPQVLADKMILVRSALLLAVVFWGWSFVATKVALDYVTPVELVGLRYLLALPVLGILILVKKVKVRFNGSEWITVALSALVITVHFVIQIIGIGYTTATNSGWIIAITPLIIAVLSFLFLKERLSLKQIAGVAIATVGILFLVSRGKLDSLDWLQSTGDWLVLGSAHTWAIYTIMIRNISRKRNPLMLSFMILLLSSVLVFAYMAVTSDWTRFVHLPLEPTLAILFLGVVCLGLAFWFWQEGVSRLGAGRAGFFLYLEPLATTGLAVPYLGESFGLFTAIGGALVLLGVFLAERVGKNASCS